MRLQSEEEYPDCDVELNVGRTADLLLCDFCRIRDKNKIKVNGYIHGINAWGISVFWLWKEKGRWQK